MRWLLVARSVVSASCLVGCATLAGINDGEDRVDTPAEAGADIDSAVSTTDSGAADDSSVAPCAPGGNAEDSASTLHATKVTTAVKIDGDGADWGCVDRLAFTTGQQVVGLSPARGVADVAMQWDETHLYLWAKVKTEPQPGTSPRLSNFRNDSFHLYVTSRNPTQTYTLDDHQIVVDALKQVADYAISTRPGLTGIDATAGPSVNEGGLTVFVVEMKVDAGIIGRTSFAQGDTVRVNFQINDQPDVANNYRVWFRDNAVCKKFGGCDKAGGSEPSCDPSCTGTVVLR